MSNSSLFSFIQCLFDFTKRFPKISLCWYYMSIIFIYDYIWHNRKVKLTWHFKKCKIFIDVDLEYWIEELLWDVMNQIKKKKQRNCHRSISLKNFILLCNINSSLQVARDKNKKKKERKKWIHENYITTLLVLTWRVITGDSFATHLNFKGERILYVSGLQVVTRNESTLYS